MKAKHSIKGFLDDSLWSIIGLSIMNIISQFVVYPVWHNHYGDEKYGNIIYIMSIINIFSISVGSSVNYIRMLDEANEKTQNGKYSRFLFRMSPIMGVICLAVSFFSLPKLSSVDSLCIVILSILIMWRYYADVEYRLNLNYRGYCLYYIIISLGYLLGCYFFYLTNIWALTLIVGEAFGLIWVYCKGTVFKRSCKALDEKKGMFYKNVAYLTGASLTSNVIFNGDRLILQNFLNGTAVTTYYLASLLGKTMSLITTPMNSVIIGYLTRYKGKIKRKVINYIIIGSIGIIMLCTVVSTFASYIIIYLLYPNNLLQVKDFFIIANLTQVIYFVCNVLLTILLRIGKIHSQLYTNIVYAALFVLLCPFCAVKFGMWGFCFSLLIVNFTKYMLCIILCYYYTK